MLLLVTDTSGKDGFVGLVRADERVEVIEEVPLAGGTFSAQLVPQISGLLAKHGFSKKEIGAFIVVSGPGSFTGLRVGLAAIKALAEILRKPIVPVSLLEVVARSIIWVAGEPVSRVSFAVALDAGRGEAFIGQYTQEFTDKRLGSLECTSESLAPLGELARLADESTDRILTPDASLVNFVEQQLGPARKLAILQAKRPRSKEVATVGYAKLQAGGTVTPEQLEANYMRRSDAEIFAKPASDS